MSIVTLLGKQQDFKKGAESMKTLQSFDIYDGKESARKINFVRVSRWIKIKQNYRPNKNNSLWDYVTDGDGYNTYSDNFNPEKGLYLDYFSFSGKTYALNQFIAIGCIWDCIGHAAGYYENGERHFLSAFDHESYYNPLYIELDEYCENVRVYMEQ